MLDLQLEPYQVKEGETSLPPLRCPMLRTSGRLKILSIKKYLVQKLGLKDNQSSVSSYVFYKILRFPSDHTILLPLPIRLKYYAMVIRWEMSIV